MLRTTKKNASHYVYFRRFEQAYLIEIKDFKSNGVSACFPSETKEIYLRVPSLRHKLYQLKLVEGFSDCFR